MTTQADTAEQPLVVVDYSQLTNDTSTDLSRAIDDAFGPKGLGIIAIKNVPNFSALRQNLLPLAARFARLPKEVKGQYEDEKSSFNVGWSCGKERLEDGTPDTLKGSFYANPLKDIPTTDAALLEQWPAYCRPNLWPTNELPQLETAFKELGRLIFDVGILLSKHCDKHVAQAGLGKPAVTLQDVISQSPCNKGRLLCYLPSGDTATAASPGGTSTARWCGWHTDHGCLTGLTPAYYIEGDNIENEVPCPDPAAGLFIKTRDGRTVCVKLGRDQIAFQVGEAMQILSGGILQATPHCVVAPGRQYSNALTRCTLALFMQPKWDQQLAYPAGAAVEKVGVAGWEQGLSFGEFSESRFKSYYGGK